MNVIRVENEHIYNPATFYLSMECFRAPGKELLRQIRNDLPMPITIAALGNDGPPSKRCDGHFRFLCPSCNEMRATVNPRYNLAHCFHCGKNTNNIDLLLTLGYDFKSAIAVLTPLLQRHLARLPPSDATPVVR